MRAAVIGAGHIARQHLQGLEALGVERVGVCDLSEAAARSAAERFSVSGWFTDHHKMLAETRPDVVHVATPPASHFGLASDALAAGAHVIVEKPITQSLDELNKLIELADDADRVLLEDHNYLFNDSLQRLVGWLRSGELGEVVHVEVSICLQMSGDDPELAANPSLALPGGIISEFLTHMCYLTHAFVGPHRSVQTSWRKRDETSPLISDEFRALIEAERGTASMLFSAHGQPDVFLVRVYGTKMTAEAHLFEPRVSAQRSGGPQPLIPVLNGLRQSAAELVGAARTFTRKLSGGPGAYEGLWEFLRRSYASFENGTTPPQGVDDIRAVSRLFHEVVGDEKCP